MTRGERNNNPGNIDRTTIKWQGMSPDQSGDDRFVVFNTAHDGIRALAKVLLSYYRKYQLNTVRKIIDRWAPPTENDTTSYINHVAQLLGVGPDDPINAEDSDVLEVLVTAIIKHENGQCIYDDPTIIAAVDSALA
jgi:hypothetical protein